MSYGHSDAVLAHISAANKASMAELTAYQDAEASGKIAAHQALQRRQRRGQEMSKNYPEDDATHRDVMKGAKTGGGLAPPDRTAPRASGGLAPGSTPPGRGEYGPSRPLSPGQTVTPGGWAGTGAPKQENVGEPRSGSFNDAHDRARRAYEADGGDLSPRYDDRTAGPAQRTRAAMNQVRQPGFGHNNPAADNEMLTSGETMGENYAREKADTED